MSATHPPNGAGPDPGDQATARTALTGAAGPSGRPGPSGSGAGPSTSGPSEPSGASASSLPWRTVLRAARPADARAIAELVRPYSDRRILIAKDLITYFEDIQEFTVAEGAGALDGAQEGAGGIIGCGALHVMWDDIAEVRTLAVRKDRMHRGVGGAILGELLERARGMGLQRVFCLTFEVDFFTAHGFHPIWGTPVGMDTFAEMVRSHDDGVAEFLDLARVKPNTLGNTRMIIEL